MSVAVREYVVTGFPMTLEQVTEKLVSNLQLMEQSTVRDELTCLDTDQWHLLHDKYVLEAIQTKDLISFRCRRLNTRDYTPQTCMTNALDTHWELPECALKSHVSARINCHTLKPQLRLTVDRRQLLKLNSAQKIVLRVFTERYLLNETESDAYAQLQDRIVVAGLKGYLKSFQTADDYIRNELNLTPVTQDIVLVALDTLGIKPNIEPTNNRNILRDDMRADLATKHILLELLHNLQSQEAGIRKGIETEPLHDFRIAVRKSRAALKQIKAVFPQRISSRFLNTLSWMGAISGPPRDMDVYLLNFDRYRKVLPAELKDGLDPLQILIKTKRKAGYRKMNTVFDSKRYRNFVDSYRDYLLASAPAHSNLLNAAMPIKEVAAARIWKLYKRVIKLGNSIKQDSPAVDFHELRKMCKNLRYTMEFFQDFFPAKPMKRLLKTLKKLQDFLGLCNDLQVQINRLSEFSKELTPHPTQSQLAINLLIEHLHEKLMFERTEFGVLFEKFTTKKVQTIFQRFFKSKTV